MEDLIRTENLSQVYRMADYRVTALRELDLTIQTGDFVAIMGPSGSGKSSLMNILGCLARPTAGRYWLDGQEVSRLSRNDLAAVRNRKIGFVFQNYSLLPRMTALENVQLPLIYAGVPAAERHRRALDLLGSVGLTGREHHDPSRLSGGQQQRVAIARALISNPRLILADEPTGALDTRSGLEIMAILQTLNRAGMTVVIVTHEPDVAQFARRLLRFRDGRLIEDTRAASLNALETLRAVPLEGVA